MCRGSAAASEPEAESIATQEWSVGTSTKAPRARPLVQPRGLPLSSTTAESQSQRHARSICEAARDTPSHPHTREFVQSCTNALPIPTDAFVQSVIRTTCRLTREPARSATHAPTLSRSYAPALSRVRSRQHLSTHIAVHTDFRTRDPRAHVRRPHALSHVIANTHVPALLKRASAQAQAPTHTSLTHSCSRHGRYKLRADSRFKLRRVRIAPAAPMR
eukprot:6200369-Pleurochrysis_carterae.AAC.2